MNENTSPEYREGFEDGREFFASCQDPIEQASRYAAGCEVGGCDYARGWRLAAHATIWEHGRALEAVG